MPRNQFQRMVFAFITVVITVHAFVFYNIYVLNGDMLRSFNYTSSVLTAVNKQGGIIMFGTMLPIWAVVLVEFAFAYTLEVLVGSPLSFKIASKMFDMKTTNPVIFEGNRQENQAKVSHIEKKEFEIYRITPPPPKWDLQEYIRQYVQTGDDKYFYWFLHYYEPTLNEKAKFFRNKYSMEEYLNCSQRITQALSESISMQRLKY